MAPKRYSLRAIVGKRTYDVWLSMLESLVPDGRTQRLAPVVAAMMQYAARIAFEDDDLKEGSIGEYLLIAQECGDPSEVPDEVLSAVAALFRDAGVYSDREDASGMPYSIVDASIEEFIRWYMMPWE